MDGQGIILNLKEVTTREVLWQDSWVVLSCSLAEFDSALPTACFTHTKLSLLQTLGEENEATVNVIKYESANNFPLPRPILLFPGLETT